MTATQALLLKLPDTIAISRFRVSARRRMRALEAWGLCGAATGVYARFRRCHPRAKTWSDVWHELGVKQGAVMSNRFAEYAARGLVNSPIMPVAHTTDWWILRNLMEVAPILRTEKCPVYGEELIYLFYGKPCYRAHINIEPTSLSAFYLISILFDPTSIGSPHRVLPFDSGAFAKGFYKSHLHPMMTPSDFELHPTLQAAAQAVGTFFETNNGYFRNEVRGDIAFGPRDIEVEAFLSIIRTPAQTPSDDRRSAIELQINRSINILSAKVLAVILPEELLDDPFIESFIMNTLHAEPLGYYCPHARPSEDARAIMIEAKRFYESRGII